MLRSRTLTIFAIAVLAVLFLGTVLTPTALANREDISILEKDNYVKEADMESTVLYSWIMFNNNQSTHVVFLEVDAAVNGWKGELVESNFVIENNTVKKIELLVTAPNTRDYPSQNLVVTANITDLVTGQSWDETLMSANTNIAGGAYIPPTKALGFIPNFFVDLGIEQLDNEWGVFLISLIIWIIIGAIIYFVLDPVVKYFTKKTKTEIDDQILAIVKGPTFYLLVLWGIVSSLKVLDLSFSIIRNLELLYSLFLIVLVCWMAFKILKDVLLIWGKAYSEKTETTLDDVMLPLFEKLGMVVIFIIAIIAILNLMGIDVTMLLAGMGVMGLVIAFAAQDTLGNFISGMFLLTDRPFKVGDLVLMENGDYCRVETIGMRSTKLYNTFDHDVIILPNSKIANEKVINLTEPDNKMKVKVTIGVDYKTDIQKAKQIMLDVANKHHEIINDDDRDPFVRLVEFGDSAINLKLYTWVYHLDDQWRVGGEIREEIFERFKKEGIDIPFPQRVVHMQGYDDNKPSVSG